MGLLNSRFIEREISRTGSTCDIIEVSRTVGTDEYRQVTESTTRHSNIPCWFERVSQEDEVVKQGQAREGDLRFWFSSSHSSKLSYDNRIEFSGNSFEITNIRNYDPKGSNQLIEVTVAQI